MRILFFTQTPLPAVIEHLGMAVKSCTWISALAEKLRDVPGIQLAVASAYPHVPEGRLIREGIEHFYFPKSNGWFGSGEGATLERCVSVVRTWLPDVIHVHGTEHPCGLIGARKLVDVPVVISLQGLLGPYSEWSKFFGSMGPRSLFEAHRLIEPLIGRGLICYHRQMKAAARTETEIIRGNNCFLGRTEWDRAYIRARSPGACYLHVGELMRKSFWNRSWSLSGVHRHRIFFNHAGHPRKGLETLMDAVEILAPRYEDIEVQVAGIISKRSGYGRFIRRRIDSSKGRIVVCGYLDDEQLATRLCRAHVFVHPSFIDNSPNSVCEAMLLGLPIVSSFVGGIPSLLSHGETGLFFPAGDAPMLAERISTVFEDDDLAAHLGRNAAVVAKARHEPRMVLEQQLAAYEQVLGLKRELAAHG